jgi:transcriptional regulator of arginine metabolism
MKRDRVQEIRRLVSSRKISSQERLLDLLKQSGFEITQATLSRDLKAAGIAKVPDRETGYAYVVPSSGQVFKPTQSPNIPSENVLSVEFTHSFAVLKTHSGFASGVATFIDSIKLPEIIGTLAGDDTILLITREPYTKSQILSSLRYYFPDLEDRS